MSPEHKFLNEDNKGEVPTSTTPMLFGATEVSGQASTSGGFTPTSEVNMISENTPNTCIDSTDEANAGEMTMSNPETENTQKVPKKRNRLSAADRMAKLEAVAEDYKNGHPLQAIAMRQNLTDAQLKTFIAELFMDKKITPTEPHYGVCSTTCSVKNLPFLELSGCEDVRIEKIEGGGVNLTPYYSKEIC